MCIHVVMCEIVVSVVINIMHSGLLLCVEDECYANLLCKSFSLFSSLFLFLRLEHFLNLFQYI